MTSPESQRDQYPFDTNPSSKTMSHHRTSPLNTTGIGVAISSEVIE
jgi:hypothetical protein